MGFSVRVTGLRRIGNALQHRLNRYNSQKSNIFEDPLKRTIFLLKKKLRYDAQAKVSHIYTGRMEANTRSEMHVESIQSLTVRFGFFVPYGLVFSLGGKPRRVPLKSLQRWAQVRFGSPDPAVPIQRSIMVRGTKKYDILQRTWRNNQKNYINIVHKRFWKIWT